MENKPQKIVYTVVDRKEGKAFWVRIGAAWVNRDGSWNVKLDAIPTNGTLQIRDEERREDTPGPLGAPRKAPTPQVEAFA